MNKIYHLVLLQFKPSATQETPHEVLMALDRLRGVIPGLESFHGGPYASSEGLNQGYTHGFVMVFRDAAARDGYLTHPEHQKVLETYLPVLEKIVAFDFEV